MSEVLGSPFKKPKCGELYNLGNFIALKDVLGGLIDLQIVGTDPDIDQPVDGNAMTEDYYPDTQESTVNPGKTRVNPDGTFFICIETDAAQYAVVLADGTQFLITTVQSTAYLGQWYPARLLKVLESGTTGFFSVGY